MMIVHAWDSAREVVVDYNLKNLSIILVNISIRKGEDVVGFREPTVGKDPPGFRQPGLEHVGDPAAQPMELLEALGFQKEEDAAPVGPFALVEAVTGDPQVGEKVQKGLQKALRLFPDVIDKESVAPTFPEQRDGQGELATKVLAKENLVGRGVEASEFAVEGTSSMLDSLDDTATAQIAVVRFRAQPLQLPEEGGISRWAGHR
jgi:hypothetical protein